MSYITDFNVHITDSRFGPTATCFYEFRINVEDHVGGPRAVVASATANGHDSSEFDVPGDSGLPCEVAPIAGRGPSMYIYAGKATIPPQPVSSPPRR